MIFQKEDEWKKLLSKQDEAVLNELLHKISVHRSAYASAEEIKIAQLWCAFLEIKKQRDDLESRLKRMEFLIDGFVSRASQLEEGKRKAAEILEKF